MSGWEWIVLREVKMRLGHPVFNTVLALTLLLTLQGEAGASIGKAKDMLHVGPPHAARPESAQGSNYNHAAQGRDKQQNASRPALKATGEIIRDCKECPEMVVISAGHFEMGERNMKHTVTFAHAFAIGKTEVTQGQWKSIMGYNPSAFQQCGDDCPVEQVSWDEAQKFIQNLNARTGEQYRLPSEAEWEAACRAGEEQEYCGSDNVNDVAWYDGNSADTVHAVAGKQANAFGLYDMSGNVWEWAEDSYHASYTGAPVDGQPWQGDGTKRVLRGGAWSVTPQTVGAAVRGWIGPRFRFSDLGFRLARTLH